MSNGHVYEYTPRQCQLWCKENDLEYVPVLYNGTTFILKTNNYRTHFDIEKNCKMCKNKVPAEGIAIRINDTLNYEVYKLKSDLFLLKETKDLDKPQ